MNEKNLYTLLSIIKNNGDIKRLIRDDLSFQSIAELTNEAIKNNLIIYKNQTISVSEAGIETINRLDKKFKLTDKSKWIKKETKSIIPKLDKSFIFLPNQNELHF